MKPSFRRAGNPAFRTSTIAALLLSATTLAGCATTQKPPEISYDDAAPAVQTVDPPAPVQVYFLFQDARDVHVLVEVVVVLDAEVGLVVEAGGRRSGHRFRGRHGDGTARWGQELGCLPAAAARNRP